MRMIAMRTLFSAFTLVTSSVVSADSQEIGHGIIHFTGTIVEPVCEISHNDTRISSRCRLNGEMTVHTASFVEANKTIPEETGKVKTIWLNSERTLGVMLVSYN